MQCPPEPSEANGDSAPGDRTAARRTTAPRRLQGSLKDEKKKKFVTGEWFHEVKAQRFQEDLEGSDLLLASIKKKKDNSEHENLDSLENEDAGALPSEGTVLSSPGTQEKSSCDPVSVPTEEHRTKPKPRLRLSTLLPSEKRPSPEETSPTDSGIGVSPFLMTRSNSQVNDKGHEIPSVISTHLSEKDLDDFSCTAGGDVPDARNSTSEDVLDHITESKHLQRTPSVEANVPSKIPIRRTSGKGLQFPNTVVGNGVEKPDFGLAKGESLKSSNMPCVEVDGGHSVKQGPTCIVAASSNKDEEIGLDREHFKNLKNFWEKGGESLLASNGAEAPSERAGTPEINGRPTRLPQSQSSQNQSKARVSYRKPATLSSSEDEPTYTSPPRKGSGSSIPRSTYGRSKGAMVSRNSLSDGNGKHSLAEEEKKGQRCPRRSKLPIRVPLVKLDTLPRERTGILFEPETPADEFVMAEENRRKIESLAGRVQILIESVSSENINEIADTVEEMSPLGSQCNLETNEMSHMEKLCDPSDHPPENEATAAGESCTPQESVSSRLSGKRGHLSPLGKKLARPNSCSLAKSMVNLYTSTETYTKPQVLTHQYLEPERAKDWSKSTPHLVSETESDTASEISFQFSRHKKTPSMGSHSSDMASVSSVSGSVLSVYSGDFGSVDAQGHVQFALDYDEKNREFQIFVCQCKDLAVVDEKKGRTDPYVKTYLLPDKARMGKRKTSVKKRTVNPIYNEVLRYKIEKMVLLIQKLNLSVWHNDPLGRNSFLGEMEIDLVSWDWQNNKLNWYMLKPRSLSAINYVDHRGVMNLSIKYIPPGSQGRKTPPSGEVHIWVKDTKDLPQLRPSGVDSFVKCYVLPDTSKKSYQKTRIIKRDSNPVFNHTIVYDGFHTEDLKDACVELTVWDHEKLTNHFLGGIRLGLGTGSSYGIPVDWMDSTQEEVALWQEMMATANEWIEASLPLRPLAGKRKLK
uniref:Synaptotagmin-like protein 2 n=1 Tax=Salvator merianae TaxID=96440 RepID=A0A8D0CCX1_SALMN